MGTVSPWSVKGVEPEAREAAKTAARRAGMTVGQWLSKTIRAAAAHPAGNGAAVPADSRRDTGGDDVSAREAQVAAQRAQAVAELSAASMERALQRLVERIDRMPPPTEAPGGEPRWSVSIRRAD